VIRARLKTLERRSRLKGTCWKWAGVRFQCSFDGNMPTVQAASGAQALFKRPKHHREHDAELR
jgi:hypothetical protein